MLGRIFGGFLNILHGSTVYYLINRSRDVATKLTNAINIKMGHTLQILKIFDGIRIKTKQIKRNTIANNSDNINNGFLSHLGQSTELDLNSRSRRYSECWPFFSNILNNNNSSNDVKLNITQNIELLQQNIQKLSIILQ